MLCEKQGNDRRQNKRKSSKRKYHREIRLVPVFSIAIRPAKSSNNDQAQITAVVAPNTFPTKANLPRRTTRINLPETVLRTS